MRELTLPKFNNNDDSCVLLRWLYADGDTVPAGTVVAEVETSKAIEELELEQPAVLHRLVDEGTEQPIGQALAWLFESEDERQQHLSRENGARPADVAEPVSFVLSRSARELAEQHGIGEDRLRALGKQTIKSSDVQALVDAEAGQVNGSTERLSRRQRTIAAVVTESHRTVPTAFAAVAVSLTAVNRLSKADPDQPVGLVELLVRAIATQHATLPMFFSTMVDEQHVLVPEVAGVAVTVDVGNGLFLPVVRDAAGRGAAEIADELLEFRIKAVRQSFREEDFAGGHITLSLHNEPGVVLARPIVFPGQTAMVVLCGTEQELRLEADGSVRAHERTTIGISYDHRVVNGREAMQFLQNVKNLLENDDRCASLL